MRFVSLLNAHKMPIVPFFIRLEGSPTAYGSAPFEDLPGILRPRLEAVPENRRKDWRYDVFLDGELVVPWSQEELLNPGHREARPSDGGYPKFKKTDEVVYVVEIARMAPDLQPMTYVIAGVAAKPDRLKTDIPDLETELKRTIRVAQYCQRRNLWETFKWSYRAFVDGEWDGSEFNYDELCEQIKRDVVQIGKVPIDSMFYMDDVPATLVNRDPVVKDDTPGLMVRWVTAKDGKFEERFLLPTYPVLLVDLFKE